MICVIRSPKNVRRMRGLNWLAASCSTTIVIENVSPATVISEPAITDSTVRAAGPSPENTHWAPSRSSWRSTSTSTIPSTPKTTTITPGTKPRLCERFSHRPLTRLATAGSSRGMGRRRLSSVHGVPRVLIVTADIGAGHDLPARLLADSLRERGAQVTVVDGIAAGGRGVTALVRSGAETVLLRLPWLYELQYWLISTFAPTRWFAQHLGLWLGGRGLVRLVERERPDVVVSTYPGTTEVLGRLRAAGRIDVPLASAITDLAALRYWAHPAMDLHLLIHEESRAEVEAIIGRRDGIVYVRGLVRAQFERPPSRAAARDALGIGEGVPLVLVSGGGWGVGDVGAAADEVLRVPAAEAVCLCGTNEVLRERLEARNDPRLRALGFTERMPEWIAAADVLVHSTAGLTMLEAQLCGTHAVSFGWGVGHIRANNRAYERFGLAHVAPSPAALRALLPGLLAAPRPRELDYAALPAAADAVLALLAGS